MLNDVQFADLLGIFSNSFAHKERERAHDCFEWNVARMLPFESVRNSANH